MQSPTAQKGNRYPVDKAAPILGGGDSGMPDPTQFLDVEEGKAAVVNAAAHCFMQFGYNATSIDDVADYLNATKGRVYHYYRSKADLFFDVHRMGMAINLGSIEPIATGPGTAVQRFSQMCRLHLRNMLETNRFQRVVMQGVEMHLAGATTPQQRTKLELLMAERERYENLFKSVLTEGRDAGCFTFDNPSFASKAVLGILNNPVLWYRARDNETQAEREAIIMEYARFALNSVLHTSVPQPAFNRLSDGEKT